MHSNRVHSERQSRSQNEVVSFYRRKCTADYVKFRNMWFSNSRQLCGVTYIIQHIDCWGYRLIGWLTATEKRVAQLALLIFFFFVREKIKQIQCKCTCCRNFWWIYSSIYSLFRIGIRSVNSNIRLFVPLFLSGKYLLISGRKVIRFCRWKAEKVTKIRFSTEKKRKKYSDNPHRVEKTLTENLNKWFTTTWCLTAEHCRHIFCTIWRSFNYLFVFFVYHRAMTYFIKLKYLNDWLHARLIDWRSRKLNAFSNKTIVSYVIGFVKHVFINLFVFFLLFLSLQTKPLFGCVVSIRNAIVM